MPYVFKRLLSPPLYPQLLALPLLPKSEPVRGNFLGALFSVRGGTDAYNSGERPTPKGQEFYFSFSHTDVCTCACVCVCMQVYTPISIQLHVRMSKCVWTSPVKQPAGKGPSDQVYTHPLRRIRSGEGKGAYHLSEPPNFFRDDPLQDIIMCKLCYYVYG